MLGWILLAVFMVMLSAFYLLSPLISPSRISLENAHIVITGGSSGIGKCIAQEALKLKAKVTIVARDKTKLETTKQELAAVVPDGEKKISVVSVDLSKDYQEVEAAFKKSEEKLGPVDCLINNAGSAIPGRFDDAPITDFSRMININYLSAVHATRAVLPGMKARAQGRVVFVSSQAGQLGLFGYSAYSASKFALKGLAESLQMEVKPYNIYLTLAFPPDTNTPGYEEENKSKPEETRLISETAGLFSPETVAKNILSDMMAGKFYSSLGLDGLMLSTLTCGFSPVTSLTEGAQQVMAMGLFRLVALGYLLHFNRIVDKCKRLRDSAADMKKTS